MKRILHVSNDHYPRVTGGTEIFIQQLLDAQRQADPADCLMWVCHDESDDPSSKDAKQSLAPQQMLLPPIKGGSRRQRVAATAEAIPGFAELLSEFQPDVVHLHSFSERCGLSHARATKAAGARLVVTVHAPGFSCIKGNLIDERGAVCDGVLRERQCTRCRLHNGGVPRWLAGAVALQQGWPLGSESKGTIAHIFTARQLTAAFHDAWRELTGLADAIHVLAAWSRDVLLRQGVSARKVHLIRTGGPPTLPPRQRAPMQDGILRLVFWGRCHPVKGLHLLIDAIQALPSWAPVQLDCYGPDWGGRYGQDLLARVSSESRIHILGNVPKDQLLPLLQNYDLAVVPSTWLETGPLTVPEAFAAGLPVAGSDLGGIRELLAGVAGCALLPLNSDIWANYLRETIQKPEQLNSFTIPTPRLFSELRMELDALYRGLE